MVLCALYTEDMATGDGSDGVFVDVHTEVACEVILELGVNLLEVGQEGFDLGFLHLSDFFLEDEFVDVNFGFLCDCFCEFVDLSEVVFFFLLMSFDLVLKFLDVKLLFFYDNSQSVNISLQLDIFISQLLKTRIRTILGIFCPFDLISKLVLQSLDIKCVFLFQLEHIFMILGCLYSMSSSNILNLLLQ